FQDYVRKISHGDTFSSPKFWIPQNCHDDDQWQLRMTPFEIKHNYNFNNPPATWRLDQFISLNEIFPDILKGMRYYTKKTEKAFEDDDLADIEFNFGCDKPVKAHSVILAMERNLMYEGCNGCCLLINIHNETRKLAEMMGLTKLKCLIAKEMPRSLNKGNWDKFYGWDGKLTINF
ncbi:6611_t:CDS:2, partial [Funneliformis caledonium]